MKTRDGHAEPAQRRAVAVSDHVDVVHSNASGQSTTQRSTLQVQIDRSPRTLAQRRAIDEAFGTLNQRRADLQGGGMKGLRLSSAVGSPLQAVRYDGVEQNRPIQRKEKEGLAEKRSFSIAQWQKAIDEVLSSTDPTYVAEAVAIINRLEGLDLEVPTSAALPQKQEVTSGAEPIQRVVWPAVGRPVGARDDVDPITLTAPVPGDDVVVLSCGHVYQQASLAGLITHGQTNCSFRDGASLTAGWLHGPTVVHPALALALAGPGPGPVPGPGPGGGLAHVAQVVGTGVQVIAALVAIYYIAYGGPLGRALALALLMAYFNNG